jgi:hypothetical protein
VAVALLDVNVLVALFSVDHIHHEIAHDWFDEQRSLGWATCPITENGFLRLVANPVIMPDALRPTQAIDLLRQFRASGHHHFWPDRLSYCDADLFSPGGGLGHRRVTDVYLLALSTQMNGTLATFDQRIPLDAVKGARREHLTLIAPATD